MQVETEGGRSEADLEICLTLALLGGKGTQRETESASKAIFQLEVTFAAYSPGLWLKFQFHSYSWNNSPSLE